VIPQRPWLDLTEPSFKGREGRKDGREGQERGRREFTSKARGKGREEKKGKGGRRKGGGRNFVQL